MKNLNSKNFFAGLILFGATTAQGVDSVQLQFTNAGQGVVALHSQMALPVSSMYGEYTIQRSTNMANWEVVGDPIAGGVGVSDELLRSVVPLAGDQAFYRVFAAVQQSSPDRRMGEACYGYATEFSRQIQALGQLPLDEFVSRYSLTNQFLTQLTFAPTNAEFWNAFNLDPAVYNATNSAHPRHTDFRLNTNEFSIFLTNGFVVSGRLGTYSFPDSFYKVFTDDMPVYFSTDAALHAWHRSYMAMLEEVEETCLAPELQAIIESMQNQILALNSQASGTALQNGVLDADYFLAVAESLITGEDNYGSLGQAGRITSTLSLISSLRPADAPLFGTNRVLDYSQFQVRGHYTTSTQLQQYFLAMMWCQLADFRFAGSTNDNSLRELSGAIAMHLLLKNANQLGIWQDFDNVIHMFAGVPDCLTFPQLADVMNAAGITSPANLPNQAALQALQAKLMSGQLGVQNIQGAYFFSPLSRQQIKLPQSFGFMAQRFTPDSWAMSQCVFDRIIWDKDGVPDFYDKVWRRVPTALDVAFAVLGNDHTVPDIAARIAATNGLAWRDGYPYQHNLSAVRQVIDFQDSSVWTNNLYYCWLGCLRELSRPTTDSAYPDAMRRRSWAMKTLNTQLASWTELRHDTVLYAKQSYTGVVLCSYPQGFIEPRVGFWEQMRIMALRAKALISTLPGGWDFVFEPNVPDGVEFTVSMDAMYSNRVHFLDNFATNMAILRDISIKELNRQSLSSNEVFFIQSLMENPTGYSNARTFSGWYPSLYYINARAAHSADYSTSDLWDAVVTDVHTDPTDSFMGDPGCILHEGVGPVNLLMVAVNWGPGDSVVYAGPVMSHFEFQLGPTTRETDSQWKSDLRAGIQPSQPDWTRCYFVPGTFTFPSGVY